MPLVDPTVASYTPTRSGIPKTCRSHDFVTTDWSLNIQSQSPRLPRRALSSPHYARLFLLPILYHSSDYAGHKSLMPFSRRSVSVVSARAGYPGETSDPARSHAEVLDGLHDPDVVPERCRPAFITLSSETPVSDRDNRHGVNVSVRSWQHGWGACGLICTHTHQQDAKMLWAARKLGHLLRECTSRPALRTCLILSQRADRQAYLEAPRSANRHQLL